MAGKKGAWRRNKEALGLKQCSGGTRRRGACERNVGIVYYSIVEMKRKEDSG